MTQLPEIYNHAMQLAKDAGDILMAHFTQPLEITHKSTFDVVTQADKAAERFIAPALAEAYPTHHIIGEEGTDLGAPAESAEYHWYIDPLDGTVNFASGIPHFSVSIAMADANHQPLVGVVYNPTNGEMFSAYKGGGAYLNGQRIHVAQNDSLTQAILATGFPYGQQDNALNNMPQFQHFAPLVRGMRRLGSAALELSWVACGRLDAFWEWRLNRWDIFAGLLIVQEAGGITSDFSGQQSALLYDAQQILASSAALHPAMVRGLMQTYPLNEGQ